MKILKKLWYGNIEPMDTLLNGNAYYKELMTLMNRNRDELCRYLTDTQKEMLEKYDDIICETGDITKM